MRQPARGARYGIASQPEIGLALQRIADALKHPPLAQRAVL